MAIPAAAKQFKGAMDPYDLVEFQADLGDGADAILEAGETVASFELTLGAEAVAMGISISTALGYAASRVPDEAGVANRGVQFYLEVAVANRQDTIFETGVLVPLTLSITTTSTPARRRQRTLVVQVIQQ